MPGTALRSVVFTCFVVSSLIELVACRREVNMYTEYDPDEVTQSGAGITFTQSEISRLKYLFKKLPMGTSQLKPFYEILKQAEGDLQLDLNAVIPDMDQVKRHIRDDPDFREEFINMIRKHNVPEYVEVWSEDDVNLDPEDIEVEVSNRDQTQGWEGCLIDYNMVILPITEGLRRQFSVWINENLDQTDLPYDLFDPLEIPDWDPVRNPVALPLLDSHGRRPTGVMEGNFYWPGFVEECEETGVRWYYTDNSTGVPVTEKREFIGKYARLHIPIMATQDVFNLSLSFPLSESWPFGIGVCVPDTCNNDHIVRYITEENPFLVFYMTEGLIVRNITDMYTLSDNVIWDDTPAVLVLFMLLFMGFVCVLAGCYDGCCRPQTIKRKILRKAREGNTVSDGVKKTLTMKDIIKAENYLNGKPSMRDRVEVGWVGWSFYSNFRHIYTLELPTHPDWHVPSLNGIKGISFLWITFGLTWILGPMYNGTWCTSNLIAAVGRLLKDWRMIPTYYQYFANYGFLYVSGFLCVHMWYKSYADNNKKLSAWLILRYFLHHWWSIVPTSMVLLLIYSYLYLYLGSGAYSSNSVADAENCQISWWTVMTLTGNLLNLDQQCFGWFFIFFVIWQLQVASIFVIVPLVIKPVAGYVMLALMYISHLIILGIWLEKTYEGELDWYFDVLTTPWCNAGPFCIGMMFAIIHKEHKKEKMWHWTLILLLWLCSIAGIYAIVYVPWTKFNPDSPEEWSKAGEITYDFLAPQIMALCIGWIVFACEKGYGGIVSGLLKWNFWTWVSKMLLSLMIFYAPLALAYFMGIFIPFYVHQNTMSYVFYGHLFTVFIYGNMIALVVLYPLTKGAFAAVRAKTRMQLFLYGRHPEILEQFTGDAEKDKKIIEEAAEEEAERVAPVLPKDDGAVINHWLYRASPPEYNGHAKDAVMNEKPGLIDDHFDTRPDEGIEGKPTPLQTFMDDNVMVHSEEGIANDLPYSYDVPEIYNVDTF